MWLAFWNISDHAVFIIRSLEMFSIVLLSFIVSINLQSPRLFMLVRDDQNMFVFYKTKWIIIWRASYGANDLNTWEVAVKHVKPMRFHVIYQFPACSTADAVRQITTHLVIISLSLLINDIKLIRAKF